MQTTRLTEGKETGCGDLYAMHSKNGLLLKYEGHSNSIAFSRVEERNLLKLLLTRATPEDWEHILK